MPEFWLVRLASVKHRTDSTAATGLHPSLLRKDLDLGLKAAKELGVTLPVTQVTRDLVDRAVTAGHTDCDFAILLDVQAKAAGLTLKPENIAVDDGLKKKSA